MIRVRSIKQRANCRPALGPRLAGIYTAGRSGAPQHTFRYPAVMCALYKQVFVCTRSLPRPLLLVMFRTSQLCEMCVYPWLGSLVICTCDVCRGCLAFLVSMYTVYVCVCVCVCAVVCMCVQICACDHDLPFSPANGGTLLQKGR